MKPIPEAMRQKLLSRFKCQDTDSEPKIRIVATQTSTNILLSEPIHEDADPDFGDVALRQMAGEESISLAYAVCLDDGIATVYRRKFPATMDYPWEFFFELDEAEDVAIEYDGVWTMDGSREWYYLVTEEFPYIFTVEDGDLYVQKWRDTTSRLLLAQGVSQISACRGWTSSIDPDDDQGLVIGYLKNGAVYYRTFAYSSVSGCKNWELEQQVTSLGSGNTTLSVIRTNDFRLGFMTQQSGRFKMALTKRNYPGASVKPEYFHVQTPLTTFQFIPTRDRFVYDEGSLTVGSTDRLFLYDTGDHFISVLRSERVYSMDGSTQYCSGAKVYLSKALTTPLTQRFIQGCTVSSEKLSITNVEYDSANHALVYHFSWNSGYTPNIHPTAFTVTFPWDFAVRYEVISGQYWYLEGGTGTLETVVIEKYGYDSGAFDVSSLSSSFSFLTANRHFCKEDESLTVTTLSSSSFTFTPVGDIPV